MHVLKNYTTNTKNNLNASNNGGEFSPPICVIFKTMIQ